MIWHPNALLHPGVTGSHCDGAGRGEESHVGEKASGLGERESRECGGRGISRGMG